MEEIAPKVWKINVDSNVYYLQDEDIVIDAGPPEYREQVKKELSTVIDPKKVKTVIFTHLHYDHIGNFDLFPNARFFASPEEIDFFQQNRYHAVLNRDVAMKFNVNLHPLKDIKDFEIIHCPGHTHGSIALLYKKKILFSGDTLFRNGIGRTDFPCSLPEKMQESLEKLRKIKYDILAPGHDY